MKKSEGLSKHWTQGCNIMKKDFTNQGSYHLSSQHPAETSASG